MDTSPTALDIAIAQVSTPSSSASSVSVYQPRSKRVPASMFKKILPRVVRKPARVDSVLSPPLRKSTVPYPVGNPRRRAPNPP